MADDDDDDMFGPCGSPDDPPRFSHLYTDYRPRLNRRTGKIKRTGPWSELGRIQKWADIAQQFGCKEARSLERDCIAHMRQGNRFHLLKDFERLIMLAVAAQAPRLAKRMDPQRESNRQSDNREKAKAAANKLRAELYRLDDKAGGQADPRLVWRAWRELPGVTWNRESDELDYGAPRPLKRSKLSKRIYDYRQNRKAETSHSR